MYDLHTHSNYSDGSLLKTMLRAAESAGVNGIGFADHCYVSEREELQNTRSRTGINLDQTYKRRRQGIELLRSTTNIDIYDAIEMDYDRRDRDSIQRFLEEGEFDYTIGSVHRLKGKNIQVNSNFDGIPVAKRAQIVDQYFKQLVELIETELFNIAAHLDLPERTPALRGHATNEHYKQVAKAFEKSQTIPEINVGRALTSEGVIHPTKQFLQVLLNHDIRFAVGTDAHNPSEIYGRIQFLDKFINNYDIDPVKPSELS